MNGLKLDPGWRQACVTGNEGSLDLRQLHDLPAGRLARQRLESHHGPRHDAPRRLCLRVERACCKPQPIALDFGLDTTLQRDAYRLGRGFKHDGWDQVRTVDRLDQRVLDPLFAQRRVAAQFDEGLGPAVTVATVVIQHLGAQRLPGGLLLGRHDRRVDVQSARVGLLAEHIEHQLARDFGGELRMHAGARHIAAVGRRRHSAAARFDRRGHGAVVRRLVDVAQLQHATQDVLLAGLGALRVDARVEGARRDRQPGQHGEFADREVGQLLAEVGLSRRTEPVGSLAEEDLVDVDLQDPVLGQLGLDLECQRDLVDLARVQLLARQVKGARDLHGDRAAALAAPAADEVGQDRPRETRVVDPAVLVEAVVLGSEDGLLQGRRHVLDPHVLAPLFAELAQQDAIGAPDAQRDLRPVVDQRVDRRQVRVGHREHECQQQCGAEHAAGPDDANGQQHPAGGRRRPAAAAVRGGGIGGFARHLRGPDRE